MRSRNISSDSRARSTSALTLSGSGVAGVGSVAGTLRRFGLSAPGVSCRFLALYGFNPLLCGGRGLGVIAGRGTTTTSLTSTRAIAPQPTQRQNLGSDAKIAPVWPHDLQAISATVAKILPPSGGGQAASTTI